MLNHTRILIPPLTNLPAVQMLEPRPNRPTNIMVLPDDAVLSAVVGRVLFVTPVAVEVEPFEGGGGGAGGGSEGVGG